METLRPLPKEDAEKVIAKTVEILDRYGKLYRQYSKGQFEDYARYMAAPDGYADEDEFVKPKLFVDFLREVLDFPGTEYMPEHDVGAGVPDFQPSDALLHQFFFEVKGSNTRDLTAHEPQVKRYLRPPFRWGVVTNMRDIVIYDIESAITEQISLLELYRADKDQPRTILESLNTRHFLEFVVRFRRQLLDRARKIEAIMQAPNWTPLSPELVPDQLIASIHRVVQILKDDAGRYTADIPMQFDGNPDGKATLIAELDEIARELDRRYVPAREDRLGRFLKAREGSLERRAFDVFLTRVAYFTMTRVLVARMWEDIGFIDEQHLYDSGFRKWYESLGRKIQRVLTQSFNYAREKYSWLYGHENNYFWYDPPSEDAIIDVLYEFAHFELGKLDTDVLGTVYEQFVDRIDRKNKGQYYTPREVISFIWDRVGFTSEETFFRFEDGRRAPRMILDVATGSGGFLVEAAHRIRTQSKYNHQDANELINLLSCLYYGLCGCEISLFAHYITEVNLLIQLTPVIRELVDTKRRFQPLPLMLRTIPGDSLALAETPAVLFPNGTMARDQPRAIMSGNPKFRVREKLTQTNDFDFVCSNPPYVGEKGHKELFRATRAEFPFWEKHYQGKMDYLYWFVILGLHKLREGGKLGFITTSYWPTADGAAHLREYILENALIQEIIDFGETRIFEGAPGQHNMVFVLERCSNQMPNASSPEGMTSKVNVERKKQHRIKVVKVTSIPPPAGPKDRRTAIARVIEHVAKFIGRAEFTDEFVDVRMSSVVQGELTGKAWVELVREGKSPVTERIESTGRPLRECAAIIQGVVSGADSVSAQSIRLIPEARRTENSIQVGDGIFVVSEREGASMLSDAASRVALKPTYHNSDVTPYVVDKPLDKRYIVYMKRDTVLKDFPSVASHLEKYREILADRLVRYEEDYNWFCLHRERDATILAGPKIVTSRWGGDLKSFGYQTGDYFENSDLNVITPLKNAREHLKYLLGLLNSHVVGFWMSEKARQKGLTRQSMLFEIPIRRINFDDKQEVKLHDKVVGLVDDVIEAKRELAKLSGFFAERLTRLAGPEGLPEVSVEAVTRSLAGSDLRRVHNHPKVTVEPKRIEGFTLARVGAVESAADLFTKDADEKLFVLELSGKGRKTIQLIAPKEVLTYLHRALKDCIGKPWEEIKELPIAKDLTTYKAKEKEIVSSARALLHKVETLQAKIDAIVYELYGLSTKEIKAIERQRTKG